MPRGTPLSTAHTARRLAVVPLLTVLGLLGVAQPASAAGTTPQQQAAAFARTFAGTSASVTAGVLDDTGAQLAAVRDSTGLPPASTEKIATVGTALKLLGPSYRFTTLVQGTSPLPRRLPWKSSPRFYPGAVVVVGSGDPSLRNAGLASLLAALPKQGITSISGGLWLDVSRFDRVRTAPGWKASWLGTEVGPLSAFMLEQNRYRTDAAFLSDPDTGNLQTIAKWLSAHGVTVRGGLHVGRPSLPVRATLSSVSSAPLSSLATTTLQDSVNTWAEMLLKAVGATDGEGSTAHGLAVVRRTVAGVGGDLGTAYDGSGLSLKNLKNARQQLWTVRGLAPTPSLLASLPVSCTNGTLKRRLCSLTGRVHAKTGTLDGVSALTGYVVDHAGRRLWFSVQVKGNLSYGSRIGLIDRAVVALAGS